MGLMTQFIRAIGYTLVHPFDTFNVTVVRRYVDAQGHYIGELYDNKAMIGASCDNMPIDTKLAIPRLCYTYSFLDVMPADTLRVGAMTPQDNASVQAYVSMRRWLPLRVAVLNRFVEHVMERQS